MDITKRHNIRLDADQKKVIPLYLNLGNTERITPVIRAVENMTCLETEMEMQQIHREFQHRHYEFKETLNRHFQIATQNQTINKELTSTQQQLIGAYFTKEYSIESAALFNPSIVVHPNQQNLNDGEVRFLMSLRATGEGHISSIVFHTGTINKNGNIVLNLVKGPLVSSLGYISETIFHKKNILQFLIECNANIAVIEVFPNKITRTEALQLLSNDTIINLEDNKNTKLLLLDYFECNYNITFPTDVPIDNLVIFPFSKSESAGMEDLRLVKFIDENEEKYIGTYTAYNGRNFRVQMLETKDFRHFSITTLHGEAIVGKGMALFPEKIEGQYVMLGRQGGKNITLMYSNNLYVWKKYKVLQEPLRNWELLQLGNCGSPIKTTAGWLVITHAVGLMRRYVISATLLDLHNPSKIISTMNTPLITPNEQEREGYVPNVVYSGGSILVNNELFIPYAMSDVASDFISTNINTLIDKISDKNISHEE